MHKKVTQTRCLYHFVILVIYLNEEPNDSSGLFRNIVPEGEFTSGTRFLPHRTSHVRFITLQTSRSGCHICKVTYDVKENERERERCNYVKTDYIHTVSTLLHGRGALNGRSIVFLLYMSITY